MNTRITVTYVGSTTRLQVSPLGLRGLPGGPGAPGAPIVFAGFLTWDAIAALTDPTAGTAYLLTAADAAAPERANGDPAEVGDALQWSGTAWVNLGGPMQGPAGVAGADGADSTVPGPQGPAGATGPASTVPGPAGPQGDRGPAGADSTVPGPAGSQGIQGETGPAGSTGAMGPGVPTGGATGQVLAKHSATALDTEWIDPPAGTGGGVALGETSTTAYRGDRGKAAYDHSQAAHAPSNATADGAAGDAFATSHLAAFSHANIANGQTAFGWGNHDSAGYAAASSLGTAATHAHGDYATAAQGGKADTALQAAAIGVSVQGYQAGLSAWGTLTPGGAATLSVGTTTGTVAAGNDSRFGALDINGLTAEADALADGDYVPFYDTSETANRKGILTKFWDYITGKITATGIAPYLTSYSQGGAALTANGSYLDLPLSGGIYTHTMATGLDLRAVSVPTAPVCGDATLIITPGTGALGYPTSWCWLGSKPSMPAAGKRLLLNLWSDPSGQIWASGQEGTIG